MIARTEITPHQAIRASAGSGKTFQLTNRYLKLLLAGERVDRIVAMTFTRKAAGEICDRLLTRLATAVRDPAKCAELAAELGEPALSSERAAEILLSIVTQLHRLRIFTIDSFFTGIASSFALELGLPIGWTLVEGDVDQRMRNEAVNTSLKSDPQRAGELLKLISRGELNRSVAQRLNETIENVHRVFLESSYSAWHSVPRPPGLDAHEVARSIDELAAEVHGDSSLDVAAREVVARARTGQFVSLLKLKLAESVLDGTERYRSKSIPGGMFDALERIVIHARTVVARTLADQTEATYLLVDEFDRHYSHLKLSRGALRFEDVGRTLASAKLLDRLDEVSFRLDGQVAHLLLDEFQDTSLSQWLVLRPFAREIMSYADDSRSLFVVGDVKQAIYGWRGGEAGIFRDLGTDLPGLSWMPLDVSHRSAQAIIDTVNWVFTDIGTNIAIARAAPAAARWQTGFAKHSTAKKDLLGYVRFETAAHAGENESQRVITLRAAVDRVAELVQQAPSASIAVLVRQNDAIGRLIFELRKRGIDASEEGGNPLTDSPAVTLILSLLLIADHPADTAARFHLARSPLGESIGFTRHDDDDQAIRLSTRIRSELERDGYGQLMRRMAETLARVSGPRDARRLAQLVRVAHDYDRVATLRPSDFVQRVRTHKVSDPNRNSVRVMTIHQAKGLEFDVVVLPDLDGKIFSHSPPVLTERPLATAPPTRVVRYANESERKAVPDLQSLYEDSQGRTLNEALSLLYVALTRAARALFILVSPSRENEKTTPCTAAGVLRSSLAAKKPARSQAVLFEHGDTRWIDAFSENPRVDSRPASALPISLANNVGPRRRILPRKNPSLLEGGSPPPIRDRLRLESDASALRGTIIHGFFELLEWLDEKVPDDGALRSMAKRLGANSSDIEPFIASFRIMLKHPEIAAALKRSSFQSVDVRADAYLELPFALREGDGIMSGRIDRLVVRRDRSGRVIDVELFDYKTDMVRGAELDARVATYLPQMRAYQKAAASLFAVKTEMIHGRLLFVSEGRAIKI